MSELRLGAPAAAAVQQLLTDTLNDASGHAARLGDMYDAEAVHDFRVAVRRLRTFLRAFHETLPVDDQIQLELRELTELTNAARDGEAHSEWLRDRLEDPGLESAERHAVTRALTRLDGGAVRPVGLQADTQLVMSRTGGTLADLAGRALDGNRDINQATDHSFGQATAAVLDHEACRLHKRLGRIETVDDVRRIHRARLSEKRLRYVLEAVAAQLRDAAEPLQRLRSLQDTLGELHDLSSLGERLATVEPELGDMVQRRRDELFESLATDWLGTGADMFFADIAGITTTLREALS